MSWAAACPSSGRAPHALATEAAGLPFGETDTVEKLRRRVEHDLFYIACWTLWLDLRILALTIRTVVRGEGV